MKIRLYVYLRMEGGGVAYGYSLPVGHRFNVDFTLGIGYLGGSYKEYIPLDGHYAVSYTHLVGNVRHMDRMQLLAEQEQVFSDKIGVFRLDPAILGSLMPISYTHLLALRYPVSGP